MVYGLMHAAPAPTLGSPEAGVRVVVDGKSFYFERPAH
jgi:hypothetical protein